jgi:ABC-2 type transport system ATP-binding protein
LAREFELPSDTRASSLSVGNRQRLDVALALLSAPQVLLLDEPTSSLDPAQRERVWRIARGVAEAGGAVLVATHHWEEVSGLADRTLELVEGHLT